MKKLYYYKDANTKSKLIGLYINQYSERQLRIYINDIIQDFRPNHKNTIKNISLQELKEFVKLYGQPVGGEFLFIPPLNPLPKGGALE